MSQTESLPENWLKRASWPRPCGHINASLQLRTTLKGHSRSRVLTDTFLVTMSQLSSSFCLILLPLLPHWSCLQESYPVSLPMRTSPPQRLFPMDLNLHYSSPFWRVDGLSLFAWVSHTPQIFMAERWLGLWHAMFCKIFVLLKHQNLSPGTIEDCVETSRSGPWLTTPSLQCVNKTCLGSFHICCKDQLDLWFCGILLGKKGLGLFSWYLSLLLTNSKRIHDLIFTKSHRNSNKRNLNKCI